MRYLTAKQSRLLVPSGPFALSSVGMSAWVIKEVRRRAVTVAHGGPLMQSGVVCEALRCAEK